MNKHRFSYCLIVLAFINFPSYAQQNTFRDTIPASKGDTVVNGVSTPRGSYNKTEQFFDTLKNRAYQNKWSKELHNIVILPPKKPIDDTINTSRTELQYTEYTGLIIGDINFVKLDPFGKTIEDTSYIKDTWLNQTANTIHVKTSDNYLMKNLLFESGDKLDPNVIADNERLLRSLSNIEDVRIIVTQRKDNENIADLTIIIKDLWSKAFFVELKDVKSGKLELWDKNIFGTGNEFQTNIHWDPEKSDFWGYEAIYKRKNILGKFINTEVYYRNIFETINYGFDLEKRFLTPKTKYAGGIEMYKKKTIQNIQYTDTSIVPEAINTNYYDIWLGRSFSLDKKDKVKKRRNNLVVSARFFNESFIDRPEVTQKHLYNYHNKSIWLNSIGVSSQGFFRSNLVFSYGRTEDIPTGWMANLHYGKEFSEFGKRDYAGLSLRTGNYVNNIGYLNVIFEYGAFFHGIKDIQQGVSSLKINYFTNLFIFGSYKLRYFAKLNYIKGINRFEPERVTINDKNGIRGLNKKSIFGKEKLTINIESVVFTPYYLYGFRFAIFSFADFALIGNGNYKLTEMDAWSGIGIGVRIRNEKLVFPTFQFRFAYYPGLHGLNTEDYFRFSGEKKLNPGDFDIQSPEIIIYN